MPIYEYCCPECQQVFEEWQQDFEEREMNCPVCSTPAKRVISNTAFILKGSGWYVTDYAGKKPGRNGNGDSKDKSDSDAKSESKSPDSKQSDSKPSAKASDSTPSGAGPASGKASAASKSDTAG